MEKKRYVRYIPRVTKNGHLPGFVKDWKACKNRWLVVLGSDDLTNNVLVADKFNFGAGWRMFEGEYEYIEGEYEYIEDEIRLPKSLFRID